MTERAGDLAELPRLRFPANGRAEQGLLRTAPQIGIPDGVRVFSAGGCMRQFPLLKGRHDGEAGNAR